MTRDPKKPERITLDAAEHEAIRRALSARSDSLLSLLRSCNDAGCSRAADEVREERRIVDALLQGFTP